MKRILIIALLLIVGIYGAQAQCSVSASFTVVLKTTAGVTVTKVNPNTTYNVVITGPTSPSGVNVCYSVGNMVRCSSPHANDTSGGVCQLQITTRATKVNTGISFYIAPPDETINTCDCSNASDTAGQTKSYDWN